MSNPTAITQEEARKIALNAQGFSRIFKTSLSVIKQLSYIQIDTISITERAHNHVFFSRNTNFKKEEISELMERKSIFEYWSHAAAYLPMEDFRHSLYLKELYKNGEKHWFPRDKKVENYVLDRITAEGPLQSKNFDHPRTKKHEWYEWKPAKIALTNLFMDGSLMIPNRKGFQKIFDLTERVIPINTNTSVPNIEGYSLFLINNAIKAQGLVTLNEICYLRKKVKPTVKKVLQQLIENKEIQKVQIEKNDSIYYVSTINYQPTSKSQLSILSPFDNLIIQRKRIKSIFNFDYQIECYVPEKKRKFGYYTLPILFGDKFVARFDSKADRKTKVFTIKNFWFEENFTPNDEFYTKLNLQLNAFSFFCGCEKITLKNVSPTINKRDLKAAILNCQ